MGDAPNIQHLQELHPESRTGEWCSQEWIRIFIDGGASDLDDHRVAQGGCGIFRRQPPLQHACCRDGEAAQQL